MKSLNLDNVSLHNRQDYLNVLRILLGPLCKYFKRDVSTISIGYENAVHYSTDISKFETFSRSLIGISLLDEELVKKDIIFHMMWNGVNPFSDQYWGIIQDSDQKIVECLPILFFCYKNKKEFLSFFQGDKLFAFEKWFLQINICNVGNNNWCFFKILVNTLLIHLGLRGSPEIIDNSFNVIEDNYLSGGWYSDGYNNRRDYYIPFAFHFYSLLYIYINPDSKRKAIILERANLFAKDFIYFFADTGEAIPFGRSLTYKFAHIAFWAILSNFEESHHKLSIYKGIINRNLRWWFKQDIFDCNGLLVNGYTYKNPYMMETYNAIGSPYWALKSFYFLLTENITFFQVTESPFPILERKRIIPQAFFNIVREAGHAYAFVNGQVLNHAEWSYTKYEKFVYSSQWGFCHGRLGDNIEFLAPDSTIAIQYGQSLLIRKGFKIISNTPDVQISEWNPLKGIRIVSYIFPDAPSHLRVHAIHTHYAIRFMDFGYAINSEGAHIEVTNKYSKITNGRVCSEMELMNSVGEAKVCNCKPDVHILFHNVKIPFVHKYFSCGFHVIATRVTGITEKHNYNKTEKMNISSDCIEYNGKSYKIHKPAPYLKLQNIKHKFKNYVNQILG